MDEATLRAEVAKIRWYHRIDLGRGIATPGENDPAPKLEALHLPPSLRGLTVLDIGAWDGFFSFECERRGAQRVLSTDSVCWSGSGVGPGWGSKAGFDLARRALDSKVEDLKIDVMEISPEKVGVFDLVLFLGVLYHRRDPLQALERVASVTRRCAVVETAFDNLWSRRPLMTFYPGAELNADASNWWGPNPAAVEAMLRDVGFKWVRREFPMRSRPWMLARGIKARLSGKPFWPAVQMGRGVFHAWKVEPQF